MMAYNIKGILVVLNTYLIIFVLLKVVGRLLFRFGILFFLILIFIFQGWMPSNILDIAMPVAQTTFFDSLR